jgi:hypothetical protein
VRYDEEGMMHRSTLYMVINILFIGAVLVGFAINRPADVHPVYVILLFALCSTPLIEAKVVNGPYALLCLFSLDFFLMYGALDFRHLLFGSDGIVVPVDGPLTMAELVILVGGAFAQVAYRLACRPKHYARQVAPPKDWPERTLMLVGIALWIVCTRLAWEFNVYIITDATSETAKHGLESLGVLKTDIFILARMAQPLSILILAYAQCRYRRPYMVPLLVAVVLFQLFFGFVIDFKSEALIGGVLVVLTNLLVNGRVPKAWVALMLAVLIVGFPLLQANRVVRNEHGSNSTKVSENVAQTFKQVLAAKERVNSGSDRAQTALERLTLKGSVDLIVRGTGVIAPFQFGYTLSPLITGFIPRLIWPDKPYVAAGRILNSEFHLSEDADTYISPSHLGELYWNFGWAGVIVGMTLIGLLLGTLGGKFDLAEAATITRVLVIVVTVRLLILASEGELATQYVSWMRSMLVIGLLHWSFARIARISRAGANGDPALRSANAGRTPPRRVYVNLLR